MYDTFYFNLFVQLNFTRVYFSFHLTDAGDGNRSNIQLQSCSSRVSFCAVQTTFQSRVIQFATCNNRRNRVAITNREKTI